MLVKCELISEVYELMKNTPNVTGFLGGAGKPMPISDAEGRHLLNNVYETGKRPLASGAGADI